MRRISAKALALICAAVICISCAAFPAFAQDANVTYTGNSGSLIFEPGSSHSPTDLFPNFKDVMPGASISQKITVRNNADAGVKVKIYLRSLGSTDEKFNAFLDQLRLTVTKPSETPLFDAAADKTAGLTDWVCLGTLYSGATVDLDVTLDVPTTLDNMFQQQIGKIKWQFVAEESPIDEPGWECPNDPSHTCHIEEKDGVPTFVCDSCGKREPMKCEECGGEMREAIVVTIAGKTYTAYPDGADHYKTKDGRVHFHLNGENIIEYYTVDGERTDVKSVDEYTLYNYYECVDNEQHHTEPKPVPTGDDSHTWIWIVCAAAAAALIILLLLLRRRNDGRKGS